MILIIVTIILIMVTTIPTMLTNVSDIISCTFHSIFQSYHLQNTGSSQNVLTLAKGEPLTVYGITREHSLSEKKR